MCIVQNAKVLSLLLEKCQHTYLWTAHSLAENTASSTEQHLHFVFFTMFV